MEITTDIISIVSRKGGTGKTTTSINLAYSLTEKGYNVLLIDLDSQQNLTDSLQIIEEVEHSIYDVMVDDIDIRQAIVETNIKNIDLIPSSMQLADLEIVLSDVEDRELILRKKLEAIKGEYDFIILDTAPSLDNLNINSLVASDYSLITCRTSLYSFKGIEQVIELIKLIQESINPNLKILGILTTQFDKRTKVSSEFLEGLKEIYDDKVLNYISTNIALVEATLEQLPVGLYDKQATSNKQYLKLADYVIKEVLSNGE